MLRRYETKHDVSFIECPIFHSIVYYKLPEKYNRKVFQSGWRISILSPTCRYYYWYIASHAQNSWLHIVFNTPVGVGTWERWSSCRAARMSRKGWEHRFLYIIKGIWIHLLLLETEEFCKRYALLPLLPLHITLSHCSSIIHMVIGWWFEKCVSFCSTVMLRRTKSEFTFVIMFTLMFRRCVRNERMVASCVALGSIRTDWLDVAVFPRCDSSTECSSMNIPSSISTEHCDAKIRSQPHPFDPCRACFPLNNIISRQERRKANCSTEIAPPNGQTDACSFVPATVSLEINRRWVWLEASIGKAVLLENDRSVEST